ncbi:hypothetical protein BpHYR1_031343 [Brachionus plicatilis]|uniref:Uncharacterized protein n=1 Tax=Brachionus plicatilis TaxID=10195 RepID=A0A3M7RT91_BRAPC|nr:hypothetical protein BpHYR1_031343 [Brachionus plicatilis]
MNRTCEPKGVKKGIGNYVTKSRSKNLSAIHIKQISIFFVPIFTMPKLVCRVTTKNFDETNFVSANSFFIKNNKFFSNFKKSPADQLDGQNFGPFKKKRAVKDIVNIVAGGRLAVQLCGQNFGLPR